MHRSDAEAGVTPLFQKNNNQTNTYNGSALKNDQINLSERC